MQLMTQELAEQLPLLYETDGQGDQAIAYAHFFLPGGAGDWYITEFDGKDDMFGLCAIQEAELGYVTLSDLSRLYRGSLGVERELHWKPKTIAECRAELRAKGYRA